jgi:hypothetical protein
VMASTHIRRGALRVQQGLHLLWRAVVDDDLVESTGKDVDRQRESEEETEDLEAAGSQEDSRVVLKMPALMRPLGTP